MNLIEASRASYGTNEPITFEQINAGSLQRIASAVEAMAAYHVQIIKERDMYKRLHQEACQSRNELEKSNAALRGVITRMKAKP